MVTKAKFDDELEEEEFVSFLVMFDDDDEDELEDELVSFLLIFDDDDIDVIGGALDCVLRLDFGSSWALGGGVSGTSKCSKCCIELFVAVSSANLRSTSFHRSSHHASASIVVFVCVMNGPKCTSPKCA